MFYLYNPLKYENFLSVANQDKFPLSDILNAMKEFERQSEIYRRVGGLHSVLFLHPNFSVFNEDIGRHNCSDRIGGVLLKNNKMALAETGMLFVSGRVSSEIIIKVIRLGVPVLVSRSTPTAAAVNLAREYNVMLLGYVRKTPVLSIPATTG